MDAYEARVGRTLVVSIPQPRACVACGGHGTRRAVAELAAARLVAVDDCSACGGSGQVEELLPTELVVPPGVRDSDQIPVAAGGVAVVRVVAPRDSVAIRVAAAAVLFLALGFLLFLLAL